MGKNKLETAATEREEMEALEARAEDEDGEAAEVGRCQFVSGKIKFV